MEKYMTFNAGQLQFIDSLQFMNSSLEKPAANLQMENLNIMSKGLTDKELALLQWKEVNPYEYLDSYEHFYELQLPLKEDFYSILSKEAISDNDYNHMQQIWEAFGCKTLGNYHDLYIRTDVLLLAEIHWWSTMA